MNLNPEQMNAFKDMAEELLGKLGDSMFTEAQMKELETGFVDTFKNLGLTMDLATVNAFKEGLEFACAGMMMGKEQTVYLGGHVHTQVATRQEASNGTRKDDPTEREGYRINRLLCRA